MGADLYILSVYESNQKEWEAEFQKAAEARDAAPEELSRQAAQVRVEEAYEMMHTAGFFRDAYNDENLLSKFGLSWLSDFMPMLNKKACLSPEKASEFLEMLNERQAEFEAALVGLEAEELADFRDQYAELQQFLQTAIELDEPIMCSL